MVAVAWAVAVDLAGGVAVVKHDASTYVYHRCRCPICTAANTARVREYRRSRTTPNPSDVTSNLEATTQSDPATAATVRGHGIQEQRS